MLADSKLGPAIAVSDIEVAKKFYSDTLGLKMVEESQRGVSYECAGTRMGVYPSQFAGTAKNTVAGWEVDDLDAVMTELRSRGVTFEEYDMPGLKTENGVAQMGDNARGAWFKDPDGNILAIGQSIFSVELGR